MATSINPYAGFIGASAPNEVIEDTAKQLSEIVERLGARGLEQSYAPGKWTAREIVCHLADTEIAFAFRLRQTLAEPHHVIQPFDQAAWARSYDSFPAKAAVDTFSALRQWNLALIQNVGADALRKPVTHPERGDMTFQTIVETMAGHDRNHLRQLESIAGQAS
jgi:DinB superfamily